MSALVGGSALTPIRTRLGTTAAGTLAHYRAWAQQVQARYQMFNAEAARPARRIYVGGLPAGTQEVRSSVTHPPVLDGVLPQCGCLSWLPLDQKGVCMGRPGPGKGCHTIRASLNHQPPCDCSWSFDADLLTNRDLLINCF